MLSLENSKNSDYTEALNPLLEESFLIFLLDQWRISSGESRGEKYSFRDRPYLFQIASDDFWFQVIRKSAQCGITELYIARALHRLLHKRGNILYTFPALQQLRQLVGARVRPAIQDNPSIYSKVTGALNLEQIQIGNNTLYFRGVQNRRQIITVDVSELFVDELDTAVLEATKGGFGNVLYTLEKRLGAAKNPRKYYFSTPSFSGMGIDAEYSGDDTNPGSDQRGWVIKCRYCGKQQDITWDDNVVDRNEGKRSLEAYAPDVHRVCSSCREEFSPEDVLSGVWVAKKPNLSDMCHGYHVSKLMNAKPNLNQMWLDSMNPMKEQEFRCSDLGIPFEPKGSKLTDDILELARNSANYVIHQSTRDPNCMGVDVGKVLHVIIGHQNPDGKVKVIWAGEVPSWDELDQMLTRFSVRFGIVDAQPGGLEQKEFCLAHRGRMLAAYYPSYLETTKDVFKDKDEVIIHVNRTLVMSMALQAFFNNRVLLPMDIRSIRDFYKMMKAPVKATQEDATGNMRTYFPPTRVADHYFHAFVYLLTAIEKKPKDIIFLPRGVFY
jgi:hypothetical protein